MRNIVVTAALASIWLAVPASAVDFGKLFGAGGSNQKDCAWSRPHIVFENNTKETKSYTLRRRSDRSVISSVTVLAGKEEKVIMSEDDEVALNTADTLTFAQCDDKGHFPAYRWTWKKDGSVEIHPRAK